MDEESFQHLAITVTPLPGTGTGNDIECNSVGTNVVDDAIFLPNSGNYEITFAIPEDVNVEWKQSDPFCARLKKCPRKGAKSHPLMEVKSGSVGPKAFVVQAKEDPGPISHVFHYRLNFAGGATCDPIIIRD